jgi:hypothetical protein
MNPAGKRISNLGNVNAHINITINVLILERFCNVCAFVRLILLRKTQVKEGKVVTILSGKPERGNHLLEPGAE